MRTLDHRVVVRPSKVITLGYLNLDSRKHMKVISIEVIKRDKSVTLYLSENHYYVHQKADLRVNIIQL